MALIEVDWRPPKKQLRQFAAMFVVFAGGLGTLAWFDGRPLLLSQTLWGLALVVGALGLLAPAAVRPVWVVMMAVALPIGMVVSTILMLLIYYALLTPIGFLMRLGGYDPMRRRKPEGRGSFWIERRPVTDLRRYFRQY